VVGRRTPERAVTLGTSPALSTQTYRERLPAPTLAGFASCVWLQQVSPEGPAYDHRTVPNGCVEVACVKGADTVSVIGPRREPVVERLPPGSTVVGVRFRPGVPPALLGATARELVGVRVGLDQLWGRSAVTVAERIGLAATPGDAARVLEQEIVARCAAGPDPDPLVAETVDGLQPWRRRRVGELTSDLFVSPRQLRRRCNAAFGFGPKTLHRILRFQGFLALTHAFQRHEVGLGWLAVAAGYFDQAHLTRECLVVAGLTPAAFLEEMRTSCGANHDHRATFDGPRRALVLTRVASLDELRASLAAALKDPRNASDSYKRRPRVCA
jgi:AraC-like DNA-binding protein